MKPSHAHHLHSRYLGASLGLALGLGLLMAALALQPLRGQAQVATNLPPVRVSYQGFLTDGTGAALAPASPANFTVDFRIYATPSGGAVLWSERQVVTVDKGNFSVILGEGAAIVGENNLNLGAVIANRADASDRYIGLTVTISGTPNTIQPRLRLLTTPYAFLATSARSLTDANGNNRVTWSTAGSGQMEVTGDLNVTGIVKGNGSGLTGLSALQLPNIDASKVTSGTLSVDRIPSIDNTKISGVLRADQIPLIPVNSVPALPASKITSGTFTSAQIPTTLDNSRSFSGTVGIETTLPQSSLHVDSPSLSGTAVRIGNTSAGGKQWAVESTGAGSSAAGQLAIRDVTGGTTPLLISSAGIAATVPITVGSRSLVVGEATESLRIIRGVVRLVYTAGTPTPTVTVEAGSGFTVNTSGLPIGFNVDFTPDFSGTPTVTMTGTAGTTPFYTSSAASATVGQLVTASGGALTSAGTYYVHFVAIGPR